MIRFHNLTFASYRLMTVIEVKCHPFLSILMIDEHTRVCRGKGSSQSSREKRSESLDLVLPLLVRDSPKHLRW
jgi:hypothetical protein